MSKPSHTQNNDHPEGAFRISARLVGQTVFNPLFLFGGGFGSVVGWILCWIAFVMPFHRNLGEREAQLEKWSKLNQQMQEMTMVNRNLSQVELERWSAMNRDAATTFMDVQRRLHDREIRMTEIPVNFVLIPIAVLTLVCGATMSIFYFLNCRATITLEDVVHMAPADMVRTIVSRRAIESSPTIQLQSKIQ